jgi:hypothetical protein
VKNSFNKELLGINITTTRKSKKYYKSICKEMQNHFDSFLGQNLIGNPLGF